MIVGISGKAMVGKDTFAVMLAEELQRKTGDIYVLMAFAKSLKDRAQKDFDLSWDQLWGDQKELVDNRYAKGRFVEYDDNNNPVPSTLEPYWTPREIMQAYGQFFRTIDYNFWVEELFRTIEDKEYENVIITDIRHINEANAVKERGGTHIRIYRDAGGSKINDQHISETALDGHKDVDFEIMNNGTLDDLRTTAAGTVAAISALKKFTGVI